MTRTFLSSVLAIVVAAPASADVTLKQTTTGKGLGMSGTMAVTTYIKGLKMRSEMVDGNTTRVTIMDVENQKMYSFDTRRKEADVFDMQQFSAELNKSVDASQLKGTVKANGQTRQVAGQTAAGYDMEVIVPAMMGGQGGMKMTATLTGPMWIVKGAPGTQDYLNFYKGAVEKGWIFSDPRAAKGAPGQAKAMAEMYRQLVEAGGIPYEQEIQIRMSAEGPMGGLLGKMGNMTSTTTVQSVEVGSLADDLFAPPAGYKLNNRK
jgi:hypothetical protein